MFLVDVREFVNRHGTIQFLQIGPEVPFVPVIRWMRTVSRRGVPPRRRDDDLVIAKRSTQPLLRLDGVPGARDLRIDPSDLQHTALDRAIERVRR
jgi:hypothetical protein